MPESPQRNYNILATNTEQSPLPHTTPEVAAEPPMSPAQPTPGAPDLRDTRTSPIHPTAPHPTPPTRQTEPDGHAVQEDPDPHVDTRKKPNREHREGALLRFIITARPNQHHHNAAPPQAAPGAEARPSFSPPRSTDLLHTRRPTVTHLLPHPDYPKHPQKPLHTMQEQKPNQASSLKNVDA